MAKKTTKANIAQIKHKSIIGVIAYTVRTFILQLIALFATLLLSAFLSPEDFGIFFLVSAVVSLFTFLSDIGLAASLIQKKQDPTQEDLHTTFTVQQILAFTIFSIIVGLTPFWRSTYNLDSAGIILMYALASSFILSSLKTIPSILLERKLDFNKLVLPQIIENIVFYGVAVYFAYKGFGVTSYSIAIILRGLVGLVAIYLLQPYFPKIMISGQSVKSLLRFGVPFQINDLLARAKDDLLIVVMKKFISAAELGYLGWAQRWSLFPFRFTVDSVIRVTFPAYSRLQKDPDHLKIAIEKSLFFIALIIFPVLIGMAVMALPLTEIIEKYQKWQPALPALYFFIFNVMWSAITTPLTNALNAVGKINTTLKLMIMWTTLTWALTIPAIIKWGFIGAAAASAAVATSSIIALLIAKRIFQFDIWNQISRQLVAACGMGLVLLEFNHRFAITPTVFIVAIILGAGTYTALVFTLMPVYLPAQIKNIIAGRKNEKN